LIKVWSKKALGKGGFPYDLGVKKAEDLLAALTGEGGEQEIAAADVNRGATGDYRSYDR